MSAATAGASALAEELEIVNGREKYFHAIVRQPGNESSEDAFVQMNGKALYIKRQQPVILPEWAIRVFNDTLTPEFYSVPGVGAFESDSFPRYVVEVRGEATQEQYFKMLSEKKVISTDQMPRTTHLARQLTRHMQQTNL